MSDYSAYILQRVTAAVLAPLVLVHALAILYVAGNGLSAAQILARTQGSTGWFLFYSHFVLAAAIHAPLGVRNVLREWAGWRGAGLDLAMAVFALALLLAGFRAVMAVT